ncbi:MAG TPA: cytochrome b/b6 domain-containing protein [Rhizomicrobium sp.]|nr:cytochrome b/b6 domain-containing protein [Rhizomicrobium sp.]
MSETSVPQGNVAGSLAGLRAWLARPRAPKPPTYLFYRHTIPVRVLHWINAAAMLVMLMTGLQIFNAHPALYWGKSADFDHPILSMVADGTDAHYWGVTTIGPWKFNTDGVFGVSDTAGQKTIRGFPAWATIPSASPDLALGRLWHFAFAWILVTNGVLYFAYAFWTRHFQKEIVPTRQDLANLPHEIVTHAKLQFPKGEEAKHYNGLQKLSYFVVLGVLGPLIVLTGLTMSPTMDSAFPILLDIFGGRQSARTIHFIVAFSFLGFFFIHIAALVASAPINGLRSMITGYFAIEKDKTDG